MTTPCIRVERERGEETRRRLAAADLVDETREITVEGGWLYVPVTDRDAVPDDLAVVERDAPTRETQTTPADVLGFEPSIERLGDVVIVDEDDSERAREIADAVMASDLPAKTVVNRASKVKGEERVRDWEVLSGDGTEASEASRGSEDASSGTETVHREYGSEFLVDIADVYFSPRLATERHRVTEQAQPGEHALDMFAGVGPFVIPMAKRGADVVGVDVNDAAIEYLRRNAERNGVADRVTAINGDVREIADDYEGWADRLVMNLPHSADEFLDAAVRLAGSECVVHYYDIQHESDPYGPGEAAVRAAAEPAGYDVSVQTRRVVRSYAPHELNVVLDVCLARR